MITNNTRHKKFFMWPYAYYNDVFTEQELDQIELQVKVKPMEYGKVLNNLDSETRVSKNNFYYYQDDVDTRWIFHRFNEIIEDCNLKFYNFDLDGYDFFQYGEYHGSENGTYDYHMDMMPVPNENVQHFRKLSLVMLLNKPEKDFVGGNFNMQLSDSNKVDNIPMQRGKIILFPSFFIHAVTPVLQGIRKSIVIWVTGPKFR